MAAGRPSLGSLSGGGTCLDLFSRMSGMALSAELSAVVLFVDVLFDCSKLKMEESLVVSVVVEIY